MRRSRDNERRRVGGHRSSDSPRRPAVEAIMFRSHSERKNGRMPRHPLGERAAGLLVAAALLAAPGSGRAQGGGSGEIFVYNVKVVCATDDPEGGFDTFLGGTAGVLANLDSYRTEVNVLNSRLAEKGWGSFRWQECNPIKNEIAKPLCRSTPACPCAPLRPLR
jgi:hypothetical protein